MSSPQLEHGFTRIANELLEALSKVNLSAYETRVLMFILRQTYGYGKKSDSFSLSQISEATGLDRGNGGRALRSLIKRTIIEVQAGEYGIQKDYDRWAVSTKTPPCVSRDTVSVETSKVCLLRPQNSVSRDTTKERKKKERDGVKGKPSRANGSDPRVKEFFVWWDGEYRKRFSDPYHFIGGKEGSLIKRLLKSYDPTRLHSLAIRFLDSKDPWIQQHGGYTLGVFASQVNKLVSTTKASPIGPERKELPL